MKKAIQKISKIVDYEAIVITAVNMPKRKISYEIKLTLPKNLTEPILVAGGTSLKDAVNNTIHKLYYLKGHLEGNANENSKKLRCT